MILPTFKFIAAFWGLLFQVVTLPGPFVPQAGGGGGTSHTFTLVSRGTGCSQVSATGAITCTPTTGNFLVLGATGFSSGGGPYTCSVSGMTVSSGSTGHSSGTETTCLAYVFSASAGSQTFTVTWGSVTANTTTITEFSCSPACSSVTFDKDAFGTQTGTTSATPVNTPSITPTNTGELLFGFDYTAGSSTNCGGSWTNTGTAISGAQSCYILSSASGATAINIADGTSPDSWSAGIGAFR